MANACAFGQRGIADITAWNYGERSIRGDRHLPTLSAATDPVRRWADSAAKYAGV
ncbi:MAG: hypothetical protein QOI25_607 [Mycobacterium sp.]|jgi:hypothetical protein|nr:hypothetical protein [Mycobacterium sp.]